MSTGGGGGGGQPTKTETIQKNEPYEGQKQVLDPLLGEIKPVVYDQAREFFPDSTVVPYSAETEAALGLQSNRALAGSPVIDQAGNQISRSLSGEYLDSGNPHFQAMADRIRGEVTTPINSAFEAGGRYGSGIHKQVATEAFADAIAPLEYGNYQAERERQMNAVDRSFPIANQSYIDAGYLRDVGAAREGIAGEQLQEQIARHNFSQTQPSQQLAEAIGLAGNFNAGGTSTAVTTGPAQRSTGGFGQAAGLGLQAASLAIPAPKPTVICTALNDLGFVDDDLFAGDVAYGAWLQGADPQAHAGYLKWGVPVANAVRKHSWLAPIVAVIARPVIVEMAARAGQNRFGSLFGKAMLAIGLPLCRMIGNGAEPAHAH